MHRTNRFSIKKAIYDYGKRVDKTRIEWIHDNLGSVCLAANSVWWMVEMEETFRKLHQGKKNAMKTFLIQQNAQLNDLMEKGLKIITN